jgi:hypothetical protein
VSTSTAAIVVGRGGDLMPVVALPVFVVEPERGEHPSYPPANEDSRYRGKTGIGDRQLSLFPWVEGEAGGRRADARSADLADPSLVGAARQYSGPWSFAVPPGTHILRCLMGSWS